MDLHKIRERALSALRRTYIHYTSTYIGVGSLAICQLLNLGLHTCLLVALTCISYPCQSVRSAVGGCGRPTPSSGRQMLLVSQWLAIPRRDRRICHLHHIPPPSELGFPAGGARSHHPYSSWGVGGWLNVVGWLQKGGLQLSQSFFVPATFNTCMYNHAIPRDHKRCGCVRASLLHLVGTDCGRDFFFSFVRTFLQSRPSPTLSALALRQASKASNSLVLTPSNVCLCACLSVCISVPTVDVIIDELA